MMNVDILEDEEKRKAEENKIPMPQWTSWRGT